MCLWCRTRGRFLRCIPRSTAHADPRQSRVTACHTLLRDSIRNGKENRNDSGACFASGVCSGERCGRRGGDAGRGRGWKSGAAAAAPDVTKTRSYNENMEYRRLGRTGLMLSAVSMGGHWKRIPSQPGSDEFKKNRREVMAAALDHGINYIDACWSGEVEVYAEALRASASRSTSASTGAAAAIRTSPGRSRR